LKQDYIAIAGAACGYNGPQMMKSSLYDEDFFEWTRRNGQLLRAGQLQQADIEDIAEEIEDLGKRDLRELNSRVQVLLIYLLKLKLQPRRKSRSGESTIVFQRVEIEGILEQSPSLRGKLETALPDNYAKAVRRAMPEMGLAHDRFPSECPFTVEQILDPGFLL
jgi:hypothetical protein